MKQSLIGEALSASESVIATASGNLDINAISGTVLTNYNRIEQAEIRTERAETRTEQAKTRTEQAETRMEQAESRTEQAETRAEAAESRTELAQTRTEQAEARTELGVQAVRESEIRCRWLFEESTDGILIQDVATGRVTDVNPCLLRLLHFLYDGHTLRQSYN